LVLLRDIPSPGFESDTSQQTTLCDDTLAAKNCATNCIDANAFDIGMRKIFKCVGHFNGLEIALEVLEFQTHKTDDLVPVGFFKENNLIKASPDRRIELPLVICRGDDEALTMKLFNEGQEAVYYAAQLAVECLVIAQSSNSVKLIKQQNDWLSGRVIEDFPQIRRSLSEERRNNYVHAYDQQGQSNLMREDFGAKRFAAAWRTAEKKPRAGTQTVCAQSVSLPKLIYQRQEKVLIASLENQVRRAPFGSNRLHEWQLLLALEWNDVQLP